MPVGVAILGGGIFAREEHKPAVLAAPLLKLKAVYSRSLKSAKSLETDEDVTLYSDDSPSGQQLDDLLARADIDAVIIALPILAQPNIIRKALSAGKHVLSEKPIAPSVEVAKDLLQWYHQDHKVASANVTWSVAENYRFYNTFTEAGKLRADLGRLLTFRVQMQRKIELGWKYIETEWRKQPGYQGGFLLDGGVHWMAGLRQMLGSEGPITKVSAFSTQLQPHLPPVDTLECCLQTKSGALGSLSASGGSTVQGMEYTFASEKGVVGVGFDKIIVDGKDKEVKNDGSGVKPEVKAWSEAITSGNPNPRLSPEEALADLSLLEAMLRSGEQGGVPVEVENQLQ